MDSETLNIDVAIIGGGVAGLWALNLLRDQGYSAVLLEEKALGSAQTIGSQGMIHGGVKYALGGSLNAAYESVSTMPAVWRDCLAGNGAVNLRNCRLLSDSAYLWSIDRAGSRLNGFLASKLLRGKVTALQPRDYPAPFQHVDFSGNVYRLSDPVLDVPSLIETLADHHSNAIFKIDWRSSSLQRQDREASVQLPMAKIRPQCILLTAGAGNEALIRSLGGSGPGMQHRPLRQVLVKHQYQEPLFGHCIGSKPSPRLTISSHRTRNGHPVWYLGGDIATAGAGEQPDQLIQRAREELETLLPWIDLGSSQWRTLALDRAEPSGTLSRRVKGAFAGAVDGLDNVIVAWPIKLTLAPHLGEKLIGMLRQRRILPRYQQSTEALESLARPDLATPCWDALFS